MWRQNKDSGSVGAVVTVVVAVTLAVIGITQRDHIVDQVTVWNYKPPSQIAQFANEAGMSETGKFYFYTGQPLLQSATSFNRTCASTETSAAILGCYTDRRIYIYDVTDARLAAVRIVTGAHEMLHAAYDRLSQHERNMVNRLLEKQYTSIKNDPELAERMKFYDQTEPGERNNELHSIVATEFESILPELDQYYKKYFIDRAKVVALYNSYKRVFVDLKAQADQLTKQLEALAKQIEASVATYNSAIAVLNDDVTSFNLRAATSGGFASQSEFDATRQQLIARTAQLEARRSTINTQIAEHTRLREQLVGIAAQSEELNKSINSNLAPVPSV